MNGICVIALVDRGMHALLDEVIMHHRVDFIMRHRLRTGGWSTCRKEITQAIMWATSNNYSVCAT